MKKIFSIFTIVFAIIMTFVNYNYRNIIANDAVVIDIAESTHISAGTNADTNFGTSKILTVRSRASKDHNYFESLLKFNIPADIKYLQKAELTLTYENVPANAIGRSFYIYTTNSNWQQDSVTYNTMPTKYPADNFLTYTISGSLPATGDTLSIDVKDLVNSYLLADGVFVEGEITEVSFQLISAQTVNELALNFRSSETIKGGKPTLEIIAGTGDDEEILKDSIADLETMAQLNFSMDYNYNESLINENLLPNVSATTTMNKNDNFAEHFGVDPNIFNVSAILNGATSFPSINKAGYVRLYADTNDGIGNALVVKLQDETKIIEKVSFRTDNGENLVLLDENGESVSLTNENNVYTANINSHSFSIQNNNSEKVIPNIYEINIEYYGYSMIYTAFRNINMRFAATIPTELMENVESVGFDLKVGEKITNVPVNNLTDEIDGKSFGVVINDIKLFDVEITGTAYVVVNGEKLNLQSKTYSVFSIIDKYLKDAETLNLTSSQIDALNAFKEMYAK